jgi:hypothetical protein
MLCLLGTTELVQRLEAAPRMTQQCQLSATVTGRSATGIDVTVGMTIGGPAVIAATDGRRQRSNHQLGPGPTSRLASSPEATGEPQSPLPHHKTTHPCSVPRTTRARAIDAPRIARPVALTPWQGTRHLWQAKRAPFRFRHDDRLKKRCATLFKFISCLPFASLSLLPQGSEKGIFRKDPSQRRKRAPSPLLIRGSKVAPCGVRQPPQSTWAPSPLLIRGSKAGPSEGFDSRPRACRVRDDPGYVRYMAEARATLPRYPRTFPSQAGMICNGIPPEGGTEPSDPIKWVRVQQITCRYFWSAPLGH